MWSLILFLIFGGILLLQIIGDKSKTWDLKSQKKTEDEIDNIVKLDIGVERHVKQKFFEKRFEVLKEISGDLSIIMGDNWLEMFQNYPCYLGDYNVGRKIEYLDSFKKDFDSGFENIWGMAYEVWLSKHGYILYGTWRQYLIIRSIGGCDVYTRIDTSSSKDILRDANQEVYKSRETVRELNIRICKVIEKNIRHVHPEFNLRLGLMKNSDGLDKLYWNAYVESYNGTLQYLWDV